MLIAATLFTVAYAVVPEFQVAVKNLVLTITETDVYTNLGLKPLETVSPEDVKVYRYSLPPIPDGYVLVDEYTVESSRFRGYWYDAPDGSHYTIDIEQGNENSVVAIDTENAQSVTDIVINGYLGICVLKNGTIQIAWADTDRSVFLSIIATTLPKEQVIEMAQAIRYIEPQQ